MTEMLNKNLTENVVLIGMMGVGKTALGRQLAEALNYDFVDLDAALEEVCGLKLHEIYRKYGKIRYYAEETLLLKKQLGSCRRVIAAGGAMLPNSEQLALWQALGRTVWLSAQPETMLRRIKRKHNMVFLAPHTTAEAAARQIADRAAVYAEAAELRVDLDKLGIEAAAAEICEFMQTVGK